MRRENKRPRTRENERELVKKKRKESIREVPGGDCNEANEYQSVINAGLRPTKGSYSNLPGENIPFTYK